MPTWGDTQTLICPSVNTILDSSLQQLYDSLKFCQGCRAYTTPKEASRTLLCPNSVWTLCNQHKNQMRRKNQQAHHKQGSTEQASRPLHLIVSKLLHFQGCSQQGLAEGCLLSSALLPQLPFKALLSMLPGLEPCTAPSCWVV